jgi:hypothetical protein
MALQRRSEHQFQLRRPVARAAALAALHLLIYHERGL